MAEQAVTLQQGIWIDQQRLAEAGLQAPFEITIQPGEIRIRSGQVGQPTAPDAAWDVFGSLGDDAQPGRLANPAIEHDRNLCGSTPFLSASTSHDQSV